MFLLCNGIINFINNKYVIVIKGNWRMLNMFVEKVKFIVLGEIIIELFVLCGYFIVFSYYFVMFIMYFL